MRRLLALSAVTLCLITMTGCPSGPGDTVTDFMDALNERQFDQAFGLLSEKSQQLYDPKAKLAPIKESIEELPEDRRERELKKFLEQESDLDGTTWSEAESMSPVDYFAALMAQHLDADKTYGGRVAEEEIDGDEARVILETEDGKETHWLVKEQDGWKIDLTRRLSGG